MIYIENLTKIDDSKYSVGYIHYRPFDKSYGLGASAEQLNENGILVDLPPEENKEGYYSTLYYNPLEKKLFYEYTKIDQSSKQITIEDLQKQIESQSMAIAELSTLIMSKQ